eukprot:CAMPEP_0117460330 /NCGR_PEP_ID=MMETSP0784-20121206/1947_1 /TAXON_ID=39447 /ORGANISM="" /LENGTH=806 /DNA_ID=CAMNT_0005253989 /DNA_START=1 /DNA_END=2418 /DNA_ORIENTATION=+
METMGVEPRGQALLQNAVDAISEGRWDDLACLLQTHAPALRAARLRLEQRALDRHAARAFPAASRALDGESENLKCPPAPAEVAVAKKVDSHCEVVGDAVERSGLEAASWERGAVAVVRRVLASSASWADRAPWQALALTQVLVVIVYARAFTYGPGPGGFLMDDSVGIERNPNVVGAELSLAEFLRRDFWGLPMHGSGWTNKSFRPLTTLTYRWNYLLHGLKSSGFHITNVLLHVLASIAVGRTAVTSLGLPGSWAALAAAFFGVHPVHTENVLYLVGRADILAAIFGLAALNVYSSNYFDVQSLQAAPARLLRGVDQVRERGVLCGLLFHVLGLFPPVLLIIASGLCKETGFMLYALPTGMEILDHLAVRAEASHAVPAKLNRRTRLRCCVWAVATLLVFVARYRHTGGTKLDMSPQDNPISFETSWSVRALSYSYLHGIYAKLLCWPRFLCYDYSMDAIPAVRGLRDCRLLLPLAAYSGTAAAVTAALRASRRHKRAALFSLALMIIPFVPASNVFFPVGTVIGERLMYIPSAGFCLAVVVGLHGYLAPRAAGGADSASPYPGAAKRAHQGNRARRGHGPGIQGTAAETTATTSEARASSLGHWCFLAWAFVLLSAVVALSVRTLLRVHTWESADTLFVTDGKAQPTSSKTQFNLGITYMQNQDWDNAVDALVRCAWADPLSSLPFYRIGQIEILRGRFASAESWLSAAIEKFGASLMVRDEEVFHDLAVAMFQNGKPEAAERRLQVALQLNQDFPKGWNNLAAALPRGTCGVRHVALEPGNPQYWANLALLARHGGDQQTSA